MADSEALRQLARGVAAWNEYRLASPGKQDLTHIELRHGNYRGANFCDTDFDGSSFSDVDFQEARFVRARVNGVGASRTTFRGADMQGAELKGTNMTRVCLARCDMRQAKTFEFKVRHSDLVGLRFDDAALPGWHLYNCDFRESSLSGATFERVMFKRVLVEPERIDALRAAGVTLELPNEPTRAEWLDWDRFDATHGGTDFAVVLHDGRAHWVSDGRWDFFISHVSVDKVAVARTLAKALTARGQRVWFDEFEVRVGDNLVDSIEFGTRASLFGVVVLSKSFFGRRWTEAELAALSRKRLFLVLHGLTPEELRALRPELEDRASARSDKGIESVADALMAAIHEPPRAAR